MAFGLAKGNSDLLFCKVDWFSVERNQNKKIVGEIDNYHADKLLNTSDEALLDYFVSKYKMEVPQLIRDGISADQREVQIDISQDPRSFMVDRGQPFYVAGTAIEIEIPFLGDKELFYVQPTTFSLNPPRGLVGESNLYISIRGTNLEAAQVKQQIENALSQIEQCLGNLRPSVANFNNSVVPLVNRKISERKGKLLKDRSLLSSLGFSMRPRDGVGMTYASPQVGKKISPLIGPPASTSPFTPEPALTNEDYDNILDIMSNMVRVMECSPSAFANSDEETIRTHFLMHLNGHYQGQATGETFNYEGKTDILIKDKGRNIFIAECKFWRGEKSYFEAIDQLLGYLTWRDTKAAIVVFNRNKDFTNVIAKVKETTESHPNFRKIARHRSETSWVCRFVQRDDRNREMTIAVMIFDVPHLQ